MCPRSLGSYNQPVSSAGQRGRWHYYRIDSNTMHNGDATKRGWFGVGPRAGAGRLGLQPLKLAWLIPEYPRQSHTFFHRELAALRAAGVEVEVFSTRKRPDPPPHQWAREALAQTTYLHPPGPRGVALALSSLLRAGPRRLLRLVRTVLEAEVPSSKARLRLAALSFHAAELAGWMRERKLQHVHVQLCSDAAHVALLAKLLGDVTYSISHHGFLSEFGPNQRQKWKEALCGHTVSRVHREELARELDDCVPSDVVVAPMGVEPERFRRSVPYRPWQGLGRFEIFSCGRLTASKNQELLVRALARLCELGLDASLTIAGGDEAPGRPYEKVLRDLTASLGLGDRVRLLGSIGEDEVRARLEQSHVFALASNHEGVPVAVMEAMAMELPVVVTDVGGMRDLVQDGEHGRVVQQNDLEAFVRALLVIATSPELAREFGALGRNAVVARFHAGVSAAALSAQLQRKLQARA